MKFKTINNILKLSDLMRTTHGASMQEMRTAIQCSERSIYRFIKVMQIIAIPIHQHWDTDGNTNSKRWKIIDSELFSPLASHSDPRTMFLLRLLLEQIEPKEKTSEIAEIRDNLRKNDMLRSLTQERYKYLKTNYTTFKGYKDYSGKESLIATLSESIKNQNAIIITYQSPKNPAPKQYAIHPYSIVSHDNGLYLLAAIPKHEGKVIVLAIERIISIDSNHGEGFTIPESYDPENTFKNTFGITIEEPMNVRVQFDKSAAFYASERIWGQNQTITPAEDDSIIMCFTASGLKEICRWILSFGNHAHALNPIELIEELKKEIQGMDRLYS